jgi:hypothetical protein
MTVPLPNGHQPTAIEDQPTAIERQSFLELGLT